MGMAASQARFLGLTARKTNTEYEGQQVNQERTALANTSAGLYNKMLALTVPTPPDSNNFYNIRYTYKYGNDTFEITNYSAASSSGEYDVTVKHSSTADQAVKATTNNTSITKDAATGDWYINVGSNKTPITQITKANLAQELGISDTTFYSYVDASSVSHYMTNADYQKYTVNKTSDYTGAIDQYYYASTTQSKTENLSGVTFTVDSTGSFSTINVPGQGQANLNSESVRDDAGYENAMRIYTTNKNLYDKSISDINAQTEVIQQQDKTLELRLKQLDTEQQALQTELEAVTKVIDKNIESTFKTFA